MIKSRHTFLKLCAVRFMRKIINLKDEFYNRYIIKVEGQLRYYHELKLLTDNISRAIYLYLRLMLSYPTTIVTTFSTLPFLRY